MNVLFCAAFATFVLYAQRRRGLDEIGFGTLLSVWALGGLAGAWLAPRLRTASGRACSCAPASSSRPRRSLCSP